MTEAPKTIHILTSDAVMFARKYGHPKLELPCVGDVSDAYHHNDTVTALRDKVARLEAALGEVKADCDSRAVNGVVPIGRVAYIAVCQALEETQ